MPTLPLSLEFHLSFFFTSSHYYVSTEKVKKINKKKLLHLVLASAWLHLGLACTDFPSFTIGYCTFSCILPYAPFIIGLMTPEPRLSCTQHVKTNYCFRLQKSILHQTVTVYKGQQSILLRHNFGTFFEKALKTVKLSAGAGSRRIDNTKLNKHFQRVFFCSHNYTLTGESAWAARLPCHTLVNLGYQQSWPRSLGLKV